MPEEILSWLVEQSPALVILSVVLWRLERLLRDCVEHTQEVMDAIIAARLKDT